MPYPVLALLDFLFTNLVARGLANWWAPLFATADAQLPRWLRWLETFDASLDEGWRGGYFGVVWDGVTPGRWARYWLRVRWLYRNPAYGFSYWALGRDFDPKQWTVLAFEQTPTRDLFHAVGPDGQFNLTYYGRWGTLKLGWKAWNYFDPDTRDWKPGYVWGPLRRVPEVFSINPFRRK